MSTLTLDFETRSTVDLKKTGVYPYAVHPDTDVWCAAYAVDDGPVKVWVRDDPVPDEVAMAVMLGWTIVAHNAQFERVLWAGVMTPRYGWPEPDLRQWECTMAMAYAMALPGSLGNAAAAVGLTQNKDEAGHRLMMQMCKPRSEKGGQIIWWDDAAKLERLIAYCVQDVAVERALHKRLQRLRPQEQDLWWIDQEINERGVCLDMVTVRAAQAVVDHMMSGLDAEMNTVTDGDVAACTNVAQITAWLRSKGLDVTTLSKSALPEYLEDETLLPEVRRVIELRQDAAKASTAKLRAMEAVLGLDGRARGLFQYHGASTGRWSGRLIQTQNMPRGDLKPKDVENAIRLMVKGEIKLIDVLYGHPMAVISSCLRGLLQAAPGHDLMTLDFTSIEARVLAWLAGDEKVLNVFRGDGLVYELAASGIYNVPMAEVTKQQRLIGKISTLALGYGGGKVAFKNMAKNYGVSIAESKAEEIKVAWRKDNPKTVQYWTDLETAAIDAVQKPGRKFSVGKVIFMKAGSFLWCRLPSGRSLCYPYPVIKDKETPWGEMRPALHFKGVDSMSGYKWTELDTYGGKLAENITQAVARDILAEAVVRVHKTEMPIVMHVHDEIVVEVPEGTGDLKMFEMIMTESPNWAYGLPIAGEGWIGKRYRK